jgi:hypothetical protein
MKKIIPLIVVAFVLNYTKTFAWGSRGHKIVAQIARNFMDKNVADSVQYYLGNKSFEDASVWMDEIRSDHSYDYMKPMHYINIEKDKTYVKVSDPNIINELDLVIGELQKRNKYKKEQIKEDLLILFHLVGDLHQPLHTGYADDKGGNTVDVDFLGTRSNLHKVWDTNIIEEEKISTESCLALINAMTDKEKKSIQQINTVNWMNDSRILLNAAYSFKNDAIDKDYVKNNVPVIERQLSRAGLRLAAVLNQAFEKNIKAVLTSGNKSPQ